MTECCTMKGKALLFFNPCFVSKREKYFKSREQYIIVGFSKEKNLWNLSFRDTAGELQ